MAKRFIDTGFYKSPFVRGLQGPCKALYSFIICDCSGAGIWSKDLEIAGLYIGFKISEAQWSVFEKTGRAIPIGGDRFFFPDFIEHQYPSGLQDNNRAHMGFISELQKFNLLDGANKPLTRSLQGPMVMVMDKEMATVPEKVTAVAQVKKQSYEDFIDRFNHIKGSKFRGDDKSRRQFAARIKSGITIDEMIQALQNAMQIPFHIESKFDHLTPEFLTRSDKLDRFLNPPNASVIVSDPNRKLTRNMAVSDVNATRDAMAAFLGEKPNNQNQ